VHGSFLPLVNSLHYAAKISVLHHALKEQKKRETASLQSPVWYPERDSSRTLCTPTSMNSRL
jgi:hypothetical protein